MLNEICRLPSLPRDVHHPFAGPSSGFCRPCPVSSGKSSLTLCLFSYERAEGAKLQKRPTKGLGLASGPCLPPHPSALVRSQGRQLLPWAGFLGSGDWAGLSELLLMAQEETNRQGKL